MIVFWVCVIVIVYHHLGYPILLHYFASWHSRPGTPAQHCNEEIVDQALPAITLIVPVHNEEKVIAAKVRNLADLRYPRDRLKVILALDGCSDNTKAVVLAALEEHSGLNCDVEEYVANIGKIAVLNQQIGKVSDGVVALSDASALLGPDALLRAVRHFANPSIAVVCPAYRLIEPHCEGEDSYWHYQLRIKQDEGALGAPMGAHGAFYLFRRSLWTPLSSDTINDDFVLPMKIVLAGYRAVYDPSIVSIELENSNVWNDFFRRVRIGAGNLQQVVQLWRLASPQRLGLAFVFLSGKGLRAFMPLIIIAFVLSGAWLVFTGPDPYRWGALTVAVAVLAILVAARVGVTGAKRVTSALIYWLRGHAASALGCILMLTGLGSRAWNLSFSRRETQTTSR